MKKISLFGLIAVAASLFITGCQPTVETRTEIIDNTKPGPGAATEVVFDIPRIEVTAANAAAVKDAVTAGYTVIGFSGAELDLGTYDADGAGVAIVLTNTTVTLKGELSNDTFLEFYASGGVTVPAGSEIAAKLYVTGDLAVTAAEVTGDVMVKGKIDVTTTTSGAATISGSWAANKTITITQGTAALTATGVGLTSYKETLTIDKNLDIGSGEIQVETLTVPESVTLETTGDVTVNGSLTVSKDAGLEAGSVTVGGAITVSEGAAINTDVDVTGDLTLAAGTTAGGKIDGGVKLGGVLTVPGTDTTTLSKNGDITGTITILGFKNITAVFAAAKKIDNQSSGEITVEINGDGLNATVGINGSETVTIPAGATVTVAGGSGGYDKVLSVLSTGKIKVTDASTATKIIFDGLTVDLAGTLEVGKEGSVELANGAELKVINTTGTLTVLDNDTSAPGTDSVTLKKAVLSGDDTTIVGGTPVITLPASAEITLAAGGTIATAGSGKVSLEDTASVVLTAAAGTDGAKITGAGKVTAGKTEIVGGTNGWQAVGIGTVTIASLDSDTASIEASADTAVLTAVTGAVKPTITQLAGAGNELTIANDTIIDLKGSADVVGSITLKGNSTEANGGKITIASGGANAGIITANVAAGAAGAIVESTATGNFVVGTSTAILTADANALADGTVGNGAGVLAEIKGVAGQDVTLLPKTASVDVTLSGATVCTGSS